MTRVPTVDLPDGEARARIAQDFDTSLLVEAGAGSGKTTALLERMVGLIRSGAAEPDEIAAVTFTRKAAGELRERFQGALEGALRHGVEDPEERQRLEAALREVDRLFIGTIHAFCARLLRERPLEARLDPAFRELEQQEAVRLARRFWRSRLERLAIADDPLLARLRDVGLEPGRVEPLFHVLVEHPDVRFPTERVGAPDPERLEEVREELGALLDRAWTLMPSEEPEGGWDQLQGKVRYWSFVRRVRDWSSLPVFMEILVDVCDRKTLGVVQKRWPDGRAAKALAGAFDRFLAEGSPATSLMEEWWAHRYEVVVELARGAAAAYAAFRRRAGLLTFEDLLVHAARLLRESPSARLELGERFRHLLVDEFQDTDPLQAQILFLLASPPAEEGRGGEDWREAVPRPGALFVVGDPKQSIYRFRRADIAVYEAAKRRFEEVGDVLLLTASFRCREGIAGMVNQVFHGEGAFPEEAAEHQASFAPLRPPASRTEAPREGVFWYKVEGRRQEEVARDDAARLAAWIRERVEDDRSPGDFLVLTRLKRHLDLYARELEAWGLPVQVSGAGVGLDRELAELRLLLGALVDPADRVRVVAVLTGFFFGLDLETLLRHREEGGHFNFTWAGDQPTGRVSDALARLGRWWHRARGEPGDVFLERLAAELGLLPFAASGDLGEVRAGALTYVLDAVRTAALDGRTSLTDVLEALEASVDDPEAEAPFRPGRTDAVRVMNLHKAKGLEAPVVILAFPAGRREHEPTLHVERGGPGEAVGHLAVHEKARWGQIDYLARERSWPRWRDLEARYEAAEEIRELYVAATRASQELVVARRPESDGGSPWGRFGEWLDAHGHRLALEAGAPPGREQATASVEEIRRRIRTLEKEREARKAASYRIVSVTERAKAGVEEASGQLALEFAPTDLEATTERSRGIPWGLAVHGALAAAARGVEGRRLRSVCRSLLVENHRPVGPGGEPRELDELQELVEAVQASELWARAHRAERLLVEAPFAVELPEEGGDELMEGVVDLAFREPGGWVVADYKTDVGTDPEFPRRKRTYRKQVELYARCWEALTGERVRERVVFYTARGLEPEVF